MENIDVVVEDFRFVQKLISQAMAAAGYEVTEQEPEVLGVEEGARKVLLAFIVKRKDRDGGTHHGGHGEHGGGARFPRPRE